MRSTAVVLQVDVVPCGGAPLATMVVLCLLSALCVLAGRSAAAVFEDQKGTSDWLLENVGSIQHAELLRQSPGAVVASEDGLLALVALRDGELKWRRELAVDHMHVVEAQNVLLAAGPTGLSAWQLRLGQLLWQTSRVQAFCASADAAYTVSRGTVTRRSLSDGSTSWSAAAQTAQQHGHVACKVQGSQLYVAAWTAGQSKVALVQLAADTGAEQQSSQSVDVQHALSEHVQLADDAAFALTKDMRSICAVPLAGANAQVSCLAVADGATGTALSAAHSSAAVRLRDGGASMFSLADGKLQQVQHVSSTENVSPLFSHKGAVALSTVKTGVGTRQLTTLDQAGKELSTEDIATSSTAAVQRVWGTSVTSSSGLTTTYRCDSSQLERNIGHSATQCIAKDWHRLAWNMLLKGDFSSQSSRIRLLLCLQKAVCACRYLLQSSDGSLSFVQKGTVHWTRHEALAHVRHALMVPLPPASHPKAAEQRPGLSLQDHVKLNFLELKVWTSCLCADAYHCQIDVYRVEHVPSY